MTATALARKYRSRNFEELVGQTHVVKALSHALTTGRLHHAYLLTGTRGVGKTTIARILAKCLNCETGVTATPCGVCSACTSVEQGRFVDLLELDAASNTGVDDMREIIDNARYAPTVGRTKVYLIDEVHMLSKNAFNAMLKILEEPPVHVKFVLATTDPQKIPVTVLSRCLQFNLKQLPTDLIGEHLVDLLGKENVPFDAASIQLLARAGAGSMRDALSVTDQAIAFGHGALVADNVRQMLGVVDTDYVLRLARALAAQDGQALIAQTQSLYERGISYDSVLQELGVLFHDIALAQTVPTAQLSGAWELGELVHAFDAETVQVLYQIALTGRRDLPLSPDERAGFTMSLLRMLAFVPGSAEALPQAAPAAAPSAAARPLRASPGPRLDVEVRVEPPPPSRPAPSETRSVATPSPRVASDASAPEKAGFVPTAQLSTTTTPAPSAQSNGPTASPGSSIAFDGNWPALVARLPLVALTREFARNTALIKMEGHALFLTLPEDKRPLIKHQAKLKDILTEYFGRPIRLEVELANGEAQTTSPAPTLAKQEATARTERQLQAEAEFMAAPFVQTLMREADAVVHRETIHPVEPSAERGS